ncbi:unnamed protein product, partial [Boreogadus saida]
MVQLRLKDTCTLKVLKERPELASVLFPRSAEAELDPEVRFTRLRLSGKSQHGSFSPGFCRGDSSEDGQMVGVSRRHLYSPSKRYKAVRGDLPDPDVLKVAEAYQDFTADIAPLITTMAI